MGAAEIKYVPGCRVSVDGSPLKIDAEARLTRIEVNLDADLFARADLSFHDPDLSLINGKLFASGTAVKIELGFASKLLAVFQGEVVALEPLFRRDLPAALRVVCYDSLHRLALSQMTRALNNVDDKQVVEKIAQEHGLTGEAPSGTKSHLLQGNMTDAALLRRLAQKQGQTLRIEGKKVIIGPPPQRAQVQIGPGEGLRKFKLRIKSNKQVSSVSVHGWDPKQKREITASVQPKGETGKGARDHGKGTLSFAGNEPPPADTASAEAMAKGRLQRIAEGFATAEFEIIGDPRLVPGATLELSKHGAGIDGQYRVDKSVHVYNKHGYRVQGRAVRTSTKTAANRAAQQAAAQKQKEQQQEETPQETPQDPAHRISFWRVLDDISDTAQPVDSPVAVALEAAVVGRLHKFAQRPLASELVSARAPAGVSSVTLQTGSGSATVAMRAQGQGAESEKKLVFWYGDSSALGGAQWDDLQLVEVSASGDAPFATVLHASGGSASGTLGLIDVLAEDPDSPGTFRTLRHGVFRTRSPRLRFILPNLPLDGVRVFLDDGDDATDDELDVTRLVALQGPVTTVQMPRYVRVGAQVTGLTNRKGGRDRVFRASIETPPLEGNVGLFTFGENRLRIEKGRGSSALKLFTAYSLHYLDTAQTVPAGNGEIEEPPSGPGVFSGAFFKNSLTLDFKDDAHDAEISSALHALRLKPVSYCGHYRILEARTFSPRASQQIEDLKTQIAGFHDPLITDVARTAVLMPARGETGFQERLPAPIAGDFNAANHTFNSAHELHWHHFVLHTFPAHRLIESRIVSETRPDQVSVAGAHFVTNSAFLRPSVEPDLQRIHGLDGDNPGKKVAIFGHTDSVGPDAYNNALSRSRARSLNALLRHQLGFGY
ncbi:MAG TPA: contractile injection system protein, VgrG/Pvc8 family, partial [Myxococcales bacterium]